MLSNISSSCININSNKKKTIITTLNTDYLPGTVLVEYRISYDPHISLRVRKNKLEKNK